MEIDLSLLHSGSTDSIDISGSYTIPKEYYENTDVLAIDPVEVNGDIIKDEEDRIEEFLRTIVNEMENNFEHSEIICVNDCSADNSLSLIRTTSKYLLIWL